jgi:hypothetical protein
MHGAILEVGRKVQFGKHAGFVDTVTLPTAASFDAQANAASSLTSLRRAWCAP